MNRSMTDTANAHNVRVDVFAKQMRALSRHEREQLIEEAERVEVAELERAAIAKRIKQARQEAGLSQPEMADALGVISRTYQNYESVKQPRIPWGSMNDIAKITGKTTEWLIHGDSSNSDAATPDPFAAPASDLAERLDALVSAMEERLQHDRVIDEMLERQTAILTRIEELIAQAATPPAPAQAGSRGFSVPTVPQELSDALRHRHEAEPQAEDTPRKTGSEGQGA